MKQDYLLRAAALAAILVAGSCSVTNDDKTIAEDGSANHPIVVEPSFRDMKVQYAGGADGMTTNEAVKFDSFIADYRTRGSGSLGISVPDGPASRAAISFFAERAAASGISRDKILVSTHDVANGDYKVDVSYISYSASTDSCGDWSENLAFTAENQTPKNFGCAVQHNIAAMVSDPRDLLGPREAGPNDATRNQTIMDLYEQGKPSAATKHSVDMSTEQSAPGSDIGAN